MPVGAATEAPTFTELNLHDEWLMPVGGALYRVVFEDGTIKEGVLDALGHARLDGMPKLPAQVFYGESPAKPSARTEMPANVFNANSSTNEAASRYESETIHWNKPYEALADALSSADNDAALKDLDRFLKRWYKDLSGTGWHDSHKPNENGDQGGYHGYWSFEAGAAVILLGIEDDSSLHKYLYYPKDLVAWCREHRSLSEPGGAQGIRLRCEAGQPCLREGEWETPAQANSRRRFKQGDVMPSVEGDYGQTIWQ